MGGTVLAERSSERAAMGSGVGAHSTMHSCCALARRTDADAAGHAAVGKCGRPCELRQAGNPLLEKAAARKSGAPDYLPALQLLPAATLEFAYLPENAQGVLMLPLSGDAPGALVLAADRQRGFGEEDISWAREVARKLSEVV